MTIATRTLPPIKWHEPNEYEIHESKLFELACACPDQCGGELRFTGESMPHTYGPRSHYHQCDGCKKVWLVKGHCYPVQKWVRVEHIDEFMSDYGATKASERAQDPAGSKAAQGSKNS